MLFMFKPLPLLVVRLPIPILGGGAILKELLFAGLGGGILKDEYKFPWFWPCDGGGAMEKLDIPLEIFDVEDVAPQLFDDSVLELDALLQSIPPPVL
jgi:hypothetical protein